MPSVSLKIRAKRPWWWSMAVWAMAVPLLVRFALTRREPTEAEYAVHFRRICGLIWLEVVEERPESHGSPP